MKYLNYFRNLFNKFKPKANLIGTQSASSTTLSNTKLDYNKVRDLFIAEYSRKLLEMFKQDHETLYLKERELEKTLIPHSPKHLEVVQNMHNITANLTIIKNALNNYTDESENLLANIKSDLKLLPYKTKK